MRYLYLNKVIYQIIIVIKNVLRKCSDVYHVSIGVTYQDKL